MVKSKESGATPQTQKLNGSTAMKLTLMILKVSGVTQETDTGDYRTQLDLDMNVNSGTVNSHKVTASSLQTMVMMVSMVIIVGTQELLVTTSGVTQLIFGRDGNTVTPSMKK